MINRNNALMVLCVWGMDLTWLYAGAAFTMTAAFGTPFPLVAGVAAGGVAVGITALSEYFSRRPITAIFLHILGLAAVYSPLWLLIFGRKPDSLLQWVYLVILLLWVLFFWIDGTQLVSRPKNAYFVRNRFDMGMGIFLAVLLIELLVIVKTGIRLQGLITEILIFPFIIFGMMAFSVIQDTGFEKRYFTPGYQITGMVMSFAAVLILLGAGMVMLFLPQLTTAAETSLSLMKTAARPLGNLLVKVLIFIFDYRKRIGLRNGYETSSEPQLPTVPENTENSFINLIGWSLMIILILLAAGILLFVLWRIVSWLFRKQIGEHPDFDLWQGLMAICRRVWQKIHLLVQMTFSKSRGPRSAVELYRALAGWGRTSGLPQGISETPAEYGLRLEKRFPNLESDIQTIIGTHCEMVYGFATGGTEKFAAAYAAFKRIRSPKNWPVRIRSLLRH
jgi:hypothetical protein